MWRKVKRVILAAVVVVLAAAAIGQGNADGWPLAGGDGQASGAAGVPGGPDGEEYPESLLRLMEMNPEAGQFVMGYFQNRDSRPEIDLSGEVEEGTVPLFLQWDERWGYEVYGSDFLAVTGCGPTCLSMVWCGLYGGTEWDPLRVAEFAQQGGYYVEGVGTAWDLMTDGAAELGLAVEEVVFDAGHILARLREGSPIICAVRPGDFTTTGHFIVLSGVDESGMVRVCDPNSISNSEKAWDIEDLLPQIKNLWVYHAQQG